MCLKEYLTEDLLNASWVLEKRGKPICCKSVSGINPCVLNNGSVFSTLDSASCKTTCSVASLSDLLINSEHLGLMIQMQLKHVLSTAGGCS